MAALTIVQPTAGGTVSTAATGSASDTIAGIGAAGVYLIATCTSATANTVTISDAGRSPAGNPATTTGVSVSGNTSKAFYISPSQINTSTGLVTVTATPATSLTYQVFPA